MRRSCVLVLLILILGCSGCRLGAEIDDYSYAMVIGVDTGEKAGEYCFTYRVILPQAFAGEGKAKDEEKARIVSVSASSLSESFKLVSLAMNRRLNATHLVGVVFSEQVAKEGIYAIVNAMNKSVLFRNSVVLVVAKDSAREFIEKNQAPFEVFPSRWTESLRDNQTRSGAYFISDAREFYRQSEEQGGAGVLTCAKMEQDVDSHDLSAVAVGSAVFVDWRLVGEMTREESFGGVVLREVLRLPIDVVDTQDEKRSYSVGVRTFRPVIDIRIEDGRMVGDILIEATAEMMELSHEMDVDESLYLRLEEELNRHIISSVRSYLVRTQAWGADVVGLNHYYRRQVTSLTEWEKLDWQALYRSADIRVRADVKIKRYERMRSRRQGGDSLVL